MKNSRQLNFRPAAESLEQRRLRAALDVAVADEPPVIVAAAESTDAVAAASSDFVARHRMTSAQYNDEVARLQDLGFRPYEVSGYQINGQDYYAAIWKPTGSVSWEARHGMTSSQYQDEFTNLVGQGYRLSHVNGYTVGGIDRYAAVWEKVSGPEFVAHHRMNASQLQSLSDSYTQQGYRISSVSGYAIGSTSYYAAIWEKQSGPAYYWRYGLTSEQFQSQSEQFAATGYDLVDVSGYTVAGTNYFTGIWEQQGSADVVWRHDMSSSQYQAEFDARLAQGYELIQVDGYELGTVDRYTAAWSKPAQAFSDLPTSGNSIPQLATVTATVKQFMIERQIPSGSIAISKDGQLLAEIGLGWSDRERTQTIEPDAMFRLASVTKPMTDAVVTKLIDEGALALDDQVFCLPSANEDCLLDITPLGTADARASQINVGHLLEHRGGWDRGLSGDPLFNQVAIAGAFDVPSPPSEEQIASYVLAQPLDFTPGERYEYSNFGYMVLGLIVERVTGRDFTEYLQDEIFEPIGVPASEIELGGSLLEDRNPREPFYSHPYLGTNVFEPTELVAYPDGGFHLESMASLGGQIASASAVTRFLDRYWISGEPRTVGSESHTFYGSLPGTRTMARQRTDGFNVVVLLNQRTDASGNTYDANVLRQRVDTALNSITVTITNQDTIGLYQGDASLFHLKETFTAGASDQYFAFGPGGNAGWTPLAGDWNGDGTDTIGLYQPDASLFHLKDSFTPGASDQYFAFGPGGNAGWIPLAGDWNGDGVDTIGLYDPNLSQFHLKDSFTAGASDHYFSFGPSGNAGWIPLVGDWNGDGLDTIGLYQPDTSLFHLKDSFTPGASDQYFAFGPGGNAGWTPMSGDWNGDGVDTIGLYQPSLSLFHLKDSFTPGASDQYFAFGPGGNAGWVPLSGDWNGPDIFATSATILPIAVSLKPERSSTGDEDASDPVDTDIDFAVAAELQPKLVDGVHETAEPAVPVQVPMKKLAVDSETDDDAIRLFDAALGGWDVV